MKQLPTIQISGETDSGKSTLAYAIKWFLECYGIKCKISGREDESEVLADVVWGKRIKSLSGGTVNIKTLQLHRYVAPEAFPVTEPDQHFEDFEKAIARYEEFFKNQKTK